MNHPRHMAWCLRILAGLVLLSCVLVFMLSRWLSQQPQTPWEWQPNSDGGVRMVSTSLPALQPYVGWQVKQLQWVSGPKVEVNAVVLEPSMRWLSQANDVADYTAQRQASSVSSVVHDPAWQAYPLRLWLENPQAGVAAVNLALPAMGWSALGLPYWVLSLLALAVMVVGWVVMLSNVQWRHAAFVVLTTGQAVHIYLAALMLSLGIWAPWPLVQWEANIRMWIDIATGAALIQVAATHPRRLPHAGWISLGGWLFAIVWGWSGQWQDHPTGWWWTQTGCLLTVGMAIALMGISQQRAPHAMTVMLRRLTWVTLLTWAALVLAIGMADDQMDVRLGVTRYGLLVWHIFFASQLVMAPYLSKAKPVLQEFSLLAASSTVAAALDLFFVAVFALGPFASMALSLFLALGVYVLIRRWVVHHVLSRDPITTERLFERLYRMARELERRPDRLEEVMRDLMRELFDPLEMQWLAASLQSSEVKEHGSLLVVPLPHLSPRHDAKSLLMRHADKGRRLFTEEDARLADRIVDQIDRALRYDRAVEQGRSEERMRLAQDLHDDIGARLLTLMYQAPTPSMEEYIRHTLQDLKTLTRGLAVQSHTLTEAASEWKRDMSHRLQIAQCELDWHFTSDHDPELTVVQWSALTRILRELVNNTISHAHASHVHVSLSLTNDVVRLTVTDDGVGRDPASWSHGLGLGGVRKRVKQLGGQVSWHEAQPQGIACEVMLPHFSGLPRH